MKKYMKSENKNLMKGYIYLLLSGILLFAACKEKLTPEELAAQEAYIALLEGYQFPYKLNRPAVTYKLPAILREVSGLAMTTTEELACVQDERGIIFIYDTELKEVNRRISFAKDGDYEGLAISGADAFVLRDDGDIYHVPGFDTALPGKEKYKSLLGKKNNTKSIAYQATEKRLLIACKDGKGTSTDFREQMAIFAYNIDSNTVADSVWYSIDSDKVKHYCKFTKIEEPQEEYPEFYSKAVKSFPIFPSALAVHPKTNNIYIVSGVGYFLFVLTPDNKLIFMTRIKKSLHPQIEGMAFKKDGTLFLASEGKETPGVVHEFKHN